MLYHNIREGRGIYSKLLLWAPKTMVVVGILLRTKCYRNLSANKLAIAEINLSMKFEENLSTIDL